MSFDFKKDQREYYCPPVRPHVVFVPQMRYLSISGEGRCPQSDEPVFSLLRNVASALRDAPRCGHDCPGFQDYVLPPPEMMTWKEGRRTLWKRLYRLPDFFSHEDVEWALAYVSGKKRIDVGSIMMETISEGMCAQMLCQDKSSRKVREELSAYIASFGYREDTGPVRPLHEILLSSRRIVLRIPIA